MLIQIKKRHAQLLAFLMAVLYLSAQLQYTGMDEYGSTRNNNSMQVVDTESVSTPIAPKDKTTLESSSKNSTFFDSEDIAPKDIDGKEEEAATWSTSTSALARDDTDTSEDYCSEDGNICAFHSICYNLAGQLWHTSSDRLPSSSGEENPYPLLNSLGGGAHTSGQIGMHEKHSHCNEYFVPQSNVPYPKAEEIIYKNGTTYMVCCWVNHFGHILVQMMVSAIHALDKIGLGKVLKSNDMNFLVDNRFTEDWGSNETILNVFKFIAGRRRPNGVMSLKDLNTEAKQNEKANVCFEKLVVGMLLDDLVYPRNGLIAPGSEPGMLQLLRDHAEQLYPTTEESIQSALNETKFLSSNKEEDEKDPPSYSPPHECTVTFLRRKVASRRISNLDDVVRVTEEVFHEDKWNVRMVSFDGPSMVAQYLIVRSSMVLVSVSGTGSHMGLFLPDGGSSIEIVYSKGAKLVNRFICEVSQNLSCHSAESNCTEGRELCKRKEVLVNIDSFKQTIENVKRDISSKCDNAMESLSTSTRQTELTTILPRPLG